MPLTQNSRLRSLDVLRAAAVLLVIGAHLDFCPPSYTFFHRLGFLLFQGGWIGVDIFFVLSGFLISGLLFREHQATGKISFKRFFIRRGFKIYPPFYVFCLMTVIFGWSWGPHLFIRFLHEVLFIQNYTGPLWFHTWSLAVEEHFYLLLPWLLIYLIRKKQSSPFVSLPSICFLLAAVSLGIRILTRAAVPEFSVRTHFTPTHLRLDSLFFGVLLSYFYHYRRQPFERFVRRYSWPLITGGVLCLSPAFLLSKDTSFFIPTGGFTLFYLGAGMIVASAVVREDWFRGSFWAGAAFIGAHSYSIYIWHVFIIFCCKAVLAVYGSWPLYMAISVSGCVVMGIVMSRLIETPSLRLREKLFPSKA